MTAPVRCQESPHFSAGSTSNPIHSGGAGIEHVVSVLAPRFAFPFPGFARRGGCLRLDGRPGQPCFSRAVHRPRAAIALSEPGLRQRPPWPPRALGAIRHRHRRPLQSPRRHQPRRHRPRLRRHLAHRTRPLHHRRRTRRPRPADADKPKEPSRQGLRDAPRAVGGPARPPPQRASRPPPPPPGSTSTQASVLAR